MPTIEDRLRHTGEVWRDHVDADGGRQPLRPRHAPATPRRLALAAAAAVVVVGGGAVAGFAIHNASHPGQGHGGIAASCAAPQVLLPGSKTNLPVVHPGETVTVTGRYFLDTCNDTNPSLGPAPKPVAAHLVLRHGTRTVRLGSVQSHGELGTFRTTIRIPTDFPTGRATLVSQDPPSSALKLTVKAPDNTTTAE
ncbi:hypothetical protein [Flexivirga oryzae]|uniref:Uncharacterized protein n=1 Tax=Flexivirga oryzae TaxID=1794944 RepID=A0A839N8K2_9MICO|nr:hypothetical protein [Flexivirga oryzae]MBB2893557.1 hypothetical protein [Flexivirga oryzae]